MDGLSQTLRNLGTVRLMAMAGVAIGILVFFVFLSARLNTADLSLLYGDLDPGDSAKIISKLEGMGVPFELRGDGRQVMVPSDRVLRLRMTMAEDTNAPDLEAARSAVRRCPGSCRSSRC